MSFIFTANEYRVPNISFQALCFLTVGIGPEKSTSVDLQHIKHLTDNTSAGPSCQGDQGRS